ncbi:hypothetical protein IT575_11015 [bacterium]|nr:hypothetical protein [bacterium]
MASSGEQSDFALYEFLRSTDTHAPETQSALAFARVFADLARRVIAARCAQDGDEVAYPPGLSYYTLRAFMDQGHEQLSSRLSSMAGPDWPGQWSYLLADLAEYLARIHQTAAPERSSLQVWVGKPGQQQIRLFGWATTDGLALAGAVPPGFEALRGLPVEPYLLDSAPEAAAMLAHYDVHGLSMMALTLRYLRSIGISEPACAMSFEWTGDIGKLWKRAVPKTFDLDAGIRAVIMLDCSVHSRKPAHTLRALARLEDSQQSRLIMVDHHPDTFILAPQMLHPNLDLVLTDVFSCGLSKRWEQTELEIMALGALSDKVPEIESAFPASSYPSLHAAVEDYHQRHLQYSPTPRELRNRGEYPLRPLWEAIADGAKLEPALAERVLGKLPPAEEVPQAQYQLVGGVLVITQQLQAMGRAWYALLEELMKRENVPYAIAVRLLDKRRANFLLLTRWQLTHVPPVRYFIPERNLPQVLGHPGALWADMDKDQAPDFLREVIAGINLYLGLEHDSSTAIEQISKNILEAEPVRMENVPDPAAAPPQDDDLDD